MSASAQYDYWQRRLKGEQPPLHEGECHAGFYRLRGRNGNNDQPVAYWFASDGTLRCRIGKQDVPEQTARERWHWAQERPITHDVYKAVIASGQWPDQHEAVTRSNNAPPDDSFEGLSEAIADLARDAKKMVEAGAAKTQDDADRASDLANRLGEFWNKADGARKAEKKPHDDAVKAVQEKWTPVLTAAEIYKRLKLAVITPFLTAKQDAERKAREEATKAGQPLPEQARSTTKAGTRGRSVALRTQKSVEITDRAALLAYFADSEMMTDFLQERAEKAVRAGVTPPGIKITEVQVAA